MKPEVIVVGLPPANDLSDCGDGFHPWLAEQLKAENAAYWLRKRTAVCSLLWQE